MKVIYEPVNSGMNYKNNLGVGLGNFDGLHIGHQKLVNTLVDECKKINLSSVIYTFSKHPENIFRKKLMTPQITTVKKKIELFNSCNVDFLYLAIFDEDFSRISPEEFVKKILLDFMKVKLVVVGFDYRFGFKGAGDATLLKNLGEKYGFDVIVVSPVKQINEVISSTSVRNALLAGDASKAMSLLGRPYSMEGIIIKGRQIGRTIGFPTANILPESYVVVPKNGVYLSKIKINGVLHNSITNVGNNPTFNMDRISIETYILDFDADIYGELSEVFFYKKSTV